MADVKENLSSATHWGKERKLFAVFFDIGQHGVRPDGVAFFRKVHVITADAGEQFAGRVQKAPVDVGVRGAGQLALGQNGVDAVVVLAQPVLRSCAAREDAQQEDVGVQEPDQQAPRMPMAVCSGSSPPLK